MDTETDLLTLVNELLDAWDTHGLPTELSQPLARKGKSISSADIARMQCVVGLARHAHETARSIRLLVEHGHINSAVPLVRFAYECALTAVWLVQSEGDDGINAFLHEHVRKNQTLQSNLEKAMTATFRENADAVADTDLSRFVGSTDSARQFYTICTDLDPGGEDAYIYFRALSSLSHASVSVVDLYYEKATEGAFVPSQRGGAYEPLGVDFLLFLTSACMVWSGRAVTYLSKNDDYRRVLRSCARRIGITAEIQLSDRYRKRHAKARGKAK